MHNDKSQPAPGRPQEGRPTLKQLKAHLDTMVIIDKKDVVPSRRFMIRLLLAAQKKGLRINWKCLIVCSDTEFILCDMPQETVDRECIDPQLICKRRFARWDFYTPTEYWDRISEEQNG